MLRLGLRTVALSLTAFCSRFSGMPSDCARGRSQLCLRAVIKEWSKRSAAPAAARETQPWRWCEFPAQPPLSSPFWLEKCPSSADHVYKLNDYKLLYINDSLQRMLMFYCHIQSFSGLLTCFPVKAETKVVSVYIPLTKNNWIAIESNFDTSEPHLMKWGFVISRELVMCSINVMYFRHLKIMLVIRV